MIEPDKIYSWLTLGGLGAVAGVARYIHGLDEGGRKFSFRAFFLHLVLSAIIAVFAGFMTEHFAVTGPLQYAIVGGAAFSAREICQIVPGIVTKLSKRTLP